MDIKKLTIIIIFLVIAIIGATTLVAVQKPQLHKTFMLEKLIIKKAK